ncbi:unnamed protein product [Notodromas monacha]|uniref:Solute carrier family 40 protein n=1 Tax=Notodromas monacha TaxID=399045 RepID=A0A7R9BEP6_9CRUS|nr:unnamed protein product [Notodromas monacha]CAG0913975.1 unnamed protein product [Notodromas monacha]
MLMDIDDFRETKLLTFNNRLQEYAYWAKPLSQAVIVFVADVAALASQASHIILSRDWIVVISAGDRALLSIQYKTISDQSCAAGYNSVMRAIDLGSNILAPSSVGFVMSLMSAKSAAVFLSAWNIVSMAIEYMLLTNIYKSFPDLAVKSLTTDNQESFFSPDGSVEDQAKIEKRGSSEWLNTWLSYFNHEVFAAAFGLSLLYMTVLGFDHVTTGTILDNDSVSSERVVSHRNQNIRSLSIICVVVLVPYAYSQGVEPWELGMFSSAGALVGMAGALSFPFLTAKLGLHRTGILGFTSEALMLSACLLSIFLRGSPFKLYVCHLLSSWGDRMWTFAVGLYMMKLYPDSLKLTAIYGITVSASIIIFGSFIGAWIDRTFRIRAARVALLTQNTNVAVCALFLLIVLTFNNRLQEYAYWAKPLSQAVIVFVADVAALASQASHIILSRDWIVVISAGDRALLSIQYKTISDQSRAAGYNSVMRAIDLGSNILAPSSVGFVMSLMSAKSAAVFLSAWNIVSMAIEYMLLTNIYKSFPDLAVKSLATDNQESFFSPDGSVEDQSKIEKRSGSSEWLNSWLSYFNHEVFSAAFGLSLLYMTVLGFDHVTTGTILDNDSVSRLCFRTYSSRASSSNFRLSFPAYAYSQGVEPWELGMFSSAGALVGMAGALSFPFLTAKLGLHRTGILGFTSEALMLSACLLSIFLRGSPFKVRYFSFDIQGISRKWYCSPAVNHHGGINEVCLSIVNS